ncbi:non-ribosomal peptide synthetase [Gorillibacterium sp. sgz500922]|uniref:non-ribosomal peptide synthetase n=1 Tax=Gorillibacterium sp. sgz500922 TaxID=3446694 RepID=UPI003F671BD2
MRNHLLDIIEANHELTDKGITFIHDVDQEEFLSYRELYQEALRLLHGLQAQGMMPGQELVFQVEENRPFLELFWACIIGKIIPVPLTVGTTEEARLKVYKVWEKLLNPRLIGTAKPIDELLAYGAAEEALADRAQAMRSSLINLDGVYASEGTGVVHRPEPGDIAFVQFSSGSTGDPKGVILTHENLLSNTTANNADYDIQTDEAVLSWMPLTHDMGMIAFHLCACLSQTNQYLMLPKLFIRKPILWMSKAHEHRINGMYCPNFGYRYFLSFYQEDRNYGWDLSRIRYIANGAEPISIDLCNRFVELMGRYQLRKSAMKPVYGLAEATVGVCKTRCHEEYRLVTLDRRHLQIGSQVREMDASDPNSISLADVGYPLDDCSVRIADEYGNEVQDRIVGYIHVKGKNVTEGYYNDPEATRLVKTADGWLDTGDLGFTKEGRFVIVGRAKDIIFVNGRNLYPHDIERVVEKLGGEQQWSTAACGVRNNDKQSEDLIIFLTYKKKDLGAFYDIAERIKKHVQQVMEVPVEAVIPIAQLPKTTSGKIQHYKLAQMAEAGDFQAILQQLRSIARDRQQALQEKKQPLPTADRMLSIVRSILGKDDIGIHDNFIDQGGNSLLLVKVSEELDQWFGGKVSIPDLFAYPTVAKLAAFVEQGGSFTVPTVGLPEVYFSRGKAGAAPEFEASLQGALNEGIRRLSQLAEGDAFIVLLAVFALLLQEVSGESQVSLQASTDDVHIRSLTIDFGSIALFQELCEGIQAWRRDPALGLTYACSATKRLRTEPAGHRVIPYVSYRRAFERTSQVRPEPFDIGLEIYDMDESLHLTLAYDRMRLHGGHMKDLFIRYVGLLEQLIDYSMGSKNTTAIEG